MVTSLLDMTKPLIKLIPHVLTPDECERWIMRIKAHGPEVAGINTKLTPETGLGLLFQHPIIHEGAEVKAGIKYVVRTDLMYRTES